MTENIFFGTSGPRDADIFICGESWGKEERFKQRPFVGQSGDELTRILSECGIPRNSCFFTNVVPEQPPGNEMLWFFHPTTTARKEFRPLVRGLYPKPNVLAGLEMLKAQLLAVKPKIVIGFGNYTLWALTEDCFHLDDIKGHKVPIGIGRWRGSQLYCREELGGARFLPTYHPAAVMRMWPWRYDLVHDLKARVPMALKEEWDDWSPPEYRFIIRPDFETVMRFFYTIEREAIRGPVWLAEDIETAYDHITCHGFAWSSTEAICIPWVKAGGHYWSEEEEVQIVLANRRLHANPNAKTIGMNFLYDAQYLALYGGYVPRCAADVMILHHLCWPGKPKSLNYIDSIYNHYHRFWKDEGREFHPTFSDEQHWTYNCKDCVNTYQANTHLQKVVDFLGLRQQAEWQMRQYTINLDKMIRGARIDLKARAKQSGELTILIADRCDWLEHIIPESVYPRKPKKSPWYTSPQQTAELFYDVLCIQEVAGKGKRGTKGRTCNDDALTTIGNREKVVRPICQAIQELRSLHKFKVNFVDALLDPDDRMRCMFDPTGTRTFRNSSSESAFHTGANLQTIPKGTEE